MAKGWLDNYNDSQVSLPEGFVGEGTFNGPKFDSPAWGGQFQDGGEIPMAQNGTKKPIPSYKDFLASIKKDKVVDYKERPREVVSESTKTVVPKLQKKLTKQQAKIVQEDFYKNPVKQEGITSGDKAVDFLYNNEWLMDVPIVGGYIKNKAKQIAKDSGGRQIVDDIEKKAGATGFTDELDNYTGNTNFIRNKSTLLDQYFSKDALLPKSKYKPTDDYLEFLPSYSIKGDLDKDNQRIMALNSEIDHQTNFSHLEYKEFLKNKKPIYIKDNYTGMAGILGADLGSYKTGIAWDDKMNLPYMSVSDAWDFEPSVYSKKWAGNDAGKEKTDKAFIQSYLLHKAGNPFKVYDRFYFDPKTKEYIPDNSIQKRQTGGSVYPVNYVPEAQGGMSIPGAVGHMYARTGSPSKGPRRNQTDVTDASAQNGKEMQYYQQGLDWKPKSISKNGAWLDNYKEEIIKDDRGQWDHPGEITEIGSNEITMEGVPYDVLGVSDTGDTKLMKPGKNYKFKGKKVTEYPMAKNGVNQQDQKTLQQLDQLTNFTNYNKPTIGGWLNKYN
jgi:hypothetical protein